MPDERVHATDKNSQKRDKKNFIPFTDKINPEVNRVMKRYKVSSRLNSLINNYPHREIGDYRQKQYKLGVPVSRQGFGRTIVKFFFHNSLWVQILTHLRLQN